MVSEVVVCSYVPQSLRRIEESVRYTVGMRVLVNVSNYEGQWTVRTIHENANTPIGPFVNLAGKETLRKLLRSIGATEVSIAERERDLHNWGHGDLWVDLIPGGKNLPRLEAPWNEGLIDG